LVTYATSAQLAQVSPRASLLKKGITQL